MNLLLIVVKKVIRKIFMQKYTLHFTERNPKTADVCLGKNWKKLVWICQPVEGRPPTSRS